MNTYSSPVLSYRSVNDVIMLKLQLYLLEGLAIHNFNELLNHCIVAAAIHQFIHCRS